MTIERRHEDHAWPLFDAELAQHLESIDLGHLHVEEDEVWPVLADGGNSLTSAGALRDDVDVRSPCQTRKDAPHSVRLVIDDDHADRHDAVLAA